eukprot:TRINITY_DN12237_c0_g1_i1.p1 TRINITY_DN12237_c0_g1~~TRINITY_DN12237_c0_g1_i1.p1  ORF type:complete len:396 (-),score=77.61 TRINITY_DN12237_c0_g1_i1:142-1290(-)
MEAYTEDASTLYSAVIEKTMARLSPVFRQTGHFESERKALENLWKAKLVQGGTLRSPDTAAPRRLPTLLTSPFALTNPFETAPADPAVPAAAPAVEIKAEPSTSLKRPREDDLLPEEDEGSEQDDDEEGDELAALMPAELRGNRSALAMLKKHTNVQAFGDDPDAGGASTSPAVASPAVVPPSASPSMSHPPSASLPHPHHSQPLAPAPTSASAPVPFHQPAKKLHVPVPVSVERKLKSALSWKQRLNLKKKPSASAVTPQPTLATPPPPHSAVPAAAPPASSSTASVSPSSGAPATVSTSASTTTLDFTFAKEPAADSLDNSSLESLSDNSDIETDNVLICTFEVVKKKKSKWSWELSNGLMLADGRDYFVKSAKGGGFWM